ncbi:hypothetical protein ACEWY4_017906 [Coilia grayii]|uniref:Ig-like domain-containing protein n=1 Tax=Coilia grayii TaxID=363190 RepID=A0ABD1JIH3_9TELE
MHVLTDKPKNVLVSISASGDMGEGDRVTLTCSSDANPPVHNYTWYMKTGAESLVRGTGESISFNVTSDTSGLYYCQAQNEVGSQTSTEVAVQGGNVTVTLPAIITTFLILAVLLILGIVYFRKKNGRMTSGTRATNVDIQSESGLLYTTVAMRAATSDPTQRVATHDQYDVQYASVQIKQPKTQTTLQEGSVTYTSVQFHRGSAATSKKNTENPAHQSATNANIQAVHSDAHDDTYTALKPRSSSSQYDTLQSVRRVDDTYMPLQRTAQASVYETLQRRETPQTDMELQDLGMRRQRQM